MSQADVGLLVVAPQAAERIDFDLEPGVVLIAALFFILVNLLLAAVLYPYLSSSSEEDQDAQEAPEKEDVIGEASSDDGESLDERVDEFLEEIHQQEREG